MITLIVNGTVVNADGSQVADVLIDGETIVALGMAIVACGVTAAAWMQLLAPLANQFGLR